VCEFKGTVLTDRVISIQRIAMDEQTVWDLVKYRGLAASLVEEAVKNPMMLVRP
jgi:hypothetical protein